MLLFIFCISLPNLNGIFLTNYTISLWQKHLLCCCNCSNSLSLLEINPLAPKEMYSVLQSVRFKVTNEAVCEPIMAILVQPCWGFFHATTNLSMVGFNRAGTNTVHSECPLLTLPSPSTNPRKIYYADCQLACLVSQDTCLLSRSAWSNINMIWKQVYIILNSLINSWCPTCSPPGCVT